MTHQLFFFTPHFSQHYSPYLLDSKDQARLKQTPSLNERMNWRTSRAAKQWLNQYYPEQTLCLSHKNDHAFISAAPQKVGVDLEIFKPRNVTALAEQVCTVEEQRFISHSADPLHTFYQLWTIKEAFIKAEDLRFPTDMKAVGLTRDRDETFRLRHSQSQHYLGLNFCLTLPNQKRFMATALFPNIATHTVQLISQPLNAVVPKYDTNTTIISLQSDVALQLNNIVQLV